MEVAFIPHPNSMTKACDGLIFDSILISARVIPTPDSLKNWVEVEVSSSTLTLLEPFFGKFPDFLQHLA